MRNKTPCQGCDRRTVTCHGLCGEYQQWKADHEQKKAVADKEKEKIHLLRKRWK